MIKCGICNEIVDDNNTCKLYEKNAININTNSITTCNKCYIKSKMNNYSIISDKTKIYKEFCELYDKYIIMLNKIDYTHHIQSNLYMDIKDLVYRNRFINNIDKCIHNINKIEEFLCDLIGMPIDSIMGSHYARTRAIILYEAIENIKRR